MEDTSELKSSIKTVREGKDLSKAYEVRISGHTADKFEEIADNATCILSELEDKNQHYITDKYREIENYIGLSYDELRERHGEGFIKYLKQQYRLYKKEDPKELSNFNNPEYIKELALGYSFDFIRTLTLAKKMQITPITAPKLADVAHWVNPNILLSLTQKYPDMDKWIIKHAAVNNPTNPEGLIEAYNTRFSELREKYPDLSDFILQKAARWKNTDEVLQYLLEGKGTDETEEEELTIGEDEMIAPDVEELFLEDSLD